jgi:hypothetical protein
MIERAMAPRKPYTPPRLVVYGDVKRLTRSVAKNQADDGGPKNLKT